MTKTVIKARDFDFYMTSAMESFEAGFTTKAAQKDALDDLNRAFDELRNAAQKAILDEGNALFAYQTAMGKSEDEAWKLRSERINALGYYSVPSYPHQLRDKHLAMFGENAARATEVRDLREAIKAAPIVRVESEKAATDKVVAAVRESIIDTMQRHAKMYVDALDMGRQFGGLPVSVNAHWVINEHGTRFLRHFFYLRGKLTPLNVILAAAQTLADEEKVS